MARPVTLQKAQWVLSELEGEWGVPAPPLYVSEQMPKRYAGVYHDVDTQIRIRPQYLSEATIAHEYGHHLFHAYRPGECHGDHPECEEVARMVERWWVGGRRREHARVHGRARGRAVLVTTHPAMSREQLHQLADLMSEDPRFEDVESVGLAGDKLVFRLRDGYDRGDAQIVWAALLPLISPILTLIGISVVSWQVSTWLGTIKEWGPWILAMLVVGTAGLVVLYMITRALAPPRKV